MTGVTVRASHRSFGGTQGFYEHHSEACGGPMRFAVYLPPAALAGKKVPVLYFLAGLTCTEETFVIKAGAQRVAAELGLALVTCDTSPRAARFAGDDEADDFGLGAGFYVDATARPWSSAYRMETYVTRDLVAAVEQTFPIAEGCRGISGHSMGGHGALTLALRHPELYRSVSAFAPIVAPSRVPWGQKAFGHYFGPDPREWEQHDATALAARLRFPGPVLVDQGTTDKFLERELQPARLVDACRAASQPLELRLHDAYDHSYFFVASFVADHLQHHARILRAER